MNRLLASALRYRAWLALALTLLTGGMLTVTLDDGDPNTPPQRIEIKLPAFASTQVVTPSGVTTVTAPTPLVTAARKGLAGHAGSAEPGVVRGDSISPLAAPRQRGCVTRLVGNFSSRHGITPTQIWEHYTVSRNVVGTADVNAIVNLFDNPRFMASSHYVHDAEGNCALIVREVDKAWTQASANPHAISIENIAFGDEPAMIAGAPLRKLGRLHADIAMRWKIPLVRGSVDTRTCAPLRAGVVQHADGGPCAGGHHDIKPFSLRPIIRAARQSFAPLCARRAARRAAGLPILRTTRLARVGLRCGAEGRVRLR